MSKHKKEILCISACACIIVTAFTLMITLIINKDSKSNEVVTVNMLQYVDIGTNTPAMSKTVNYSFYSSTYSYNTDVAQNYQTNNESVISESYETDGVAEFTEITVNTNVSDANRLLYNLADTYFSCYFGNDRVSPILPMAIANVETPGRADFTKTWSALFPSRIVAIDLIETMDVTTVVSDPTIFSALSKEYSTRDRGALQMSPTYGTGNSELNALMSGNEKDKLKDVDCSNYTSWVSGASSNSGDRFYIPDVCLRLSAAMQQQVDNMIKNNYQPNNNMQLIAQCAMGHHSSGVWHFSNHSKSVGRWRTAELAYQYSTNISQQNFIDVLSNYAQQSNSNYITSDTAKNLYYSTFSEPLSTYATSDIVCTYPIKVMYAYIKLCMLYTT